MKPRARAARTVTQVVPFLFVRRMKRSVRYYVEGLGFRMVNRWTVAGRIRWCRLELGDAALMLQEFAPPAPPPSSLGTGVSLCFTCQDALAVYRGVRARRLAATEPEVGNGMWYTRLSDPDGYRLLFGSATDVAEDTKLSELPQRGLASTETPPRTRTARR